MTADGRERTTVRLSRMGQCAARDHIRARSAAGPLRVDLRNGIGMGRRNGTSELNFMGGALEFQTQFPCFELNFRKH